MRKQVYILPVLLALFFAINLVGQNYTATKLELFPGKENAYIDDLAFDSKGFIWFLSKGEIYRFNGYKSLSIMETLPREERINEVFYHILVDSEDKLWMAGIENLYVFDLKKWALRQIPKKKLPSKQNLEILDIKESPKSQVFVRYNNGEIAIIDKGNIALVSNSYLGKNKSGSLIWSFEFWKNRAWLGSTSGELYSISLEPSHKVKTHTFPNLKTSIKQIIPQDNRLIVVNLWGSNFFEIGFKKNGEIIIDNIHAFYSQKAILAKIWDYRAGKQKGVPERQKKNQLEKRTVFLKNLLRSNKIVDVSAFEVLNGELLLSTSSGVWAVYEKTKGVSSLVPINPFNKSVRGIYQFPDGSIFFCGYGGAELMDPNGAKHYFSNFNAGYSLLALDENRVLISVQGGAPRIFNKKKMEFEKLSYTIPKAIAAQGFSFPKYILSMAQDGQNIYFGSLNSLWKMNKKTRETAPLLNLKTSSQFSKLSVNHVSVEDERVLLSTSLGLIKYIPGRELEKIFPKTRTMGIYKHIALRDTIWLATQGAGLIAVDAKGEKLHQYDKSNGLSGNIVYSLIDANGYLVAGTGNGLSMIKNGHIHRLDVSDGLTQNEFNHKAAFYSEKTEKVFMGGLEGYTVLDMEQDWFGTKEPFENYFTQVSITETKNSTTTHHYSFPYLKEKNITLTPEQNLVNISIGTPKSYKTNQRPHYKIGGLVDVWQPLPAGKQITLMDLSPGEYELSIKDAEMAKSAPVRLNFKKLPAFYQTLFFKLIVFSIPIFLLWIWYRERLKKIKKEQALRSKIASDLHDDVGTLLSTISMQAEFLQISKKDPEAPGPNKTTMKKIADSSKSAIKAMGDIVWSLDARSDNWKSFIVKMREFGNQLFGESDIGFSLKTTGAPPKTLSQKEKQALYLIYKEALNNIHKHSKATKASARLVFSGNKLLLNIKDNGNGFDAATEKSGQGIKNMQMRAKEIKAKLSFSNNDKGLEISLTKTIHKKSPIWG